MYQDNNGLPLVPTDVVFKLPYSEMSKRAAEYLQRTTSHYVEVEDVFAVNGFLQLQLGDMPNDQRELVAGKLGVMPNQINEEPDTIATIVFTRLFGEDFQFIGEDISTLSVVFSISYEYYISSITGLHNQV